MAAKFESDNMLKAAHTPPVRASRMTAELLFKHINKIVQSDATVLTGNFSIRLLKAWVPRGGCALENKHLEERHAFSKHYVRINNTYKRCLLRALVVACAYLQFVAKRITEDVWRRIKANSPKQTKLATELQVKAGLYTEANRCIFNLPGTEILHLHLVEQHFNVITKLPAFFGSLCYCAKCEMAYDSDPPSTSVRMRVAPARLRAPTAGLTEHIAVTHAKCPVCKQYDETATHECFVTPPKAKEYSAPYVYYDFETYVDSGKQHRVHLVTAATSCEACPKLFPRPRCGACGGLHSLANCIAGRDLARDFTSCVSHSDCACGMREFVSVGPHSLDAFYCWLTSVFKQGAIAIAHNGSAYDAFLLLGALLNGLAKKKPQVIFQNSRLMYMKCDKITFKDSLNFIPIGLAQFPKALAAKLGYVGPYCSIEMYGGKKNKQHDSIADWLAKQEGKVFNFNKEYLDYCLQDTLILREGCLKYTRLIKDICGLDAFVQSNTISGLAMSVFTSKFMEPNTLGVISRRSDVQSHKARCWLAHLNATEFGGRLRTADSGGEAFAMGRKVDGFDPETRTVLQFHGETERFTACSPLPTMYVSCGSTTIRTRERQSSSLFAWRMPCFGGRTEAFVPHAEATETVELRYRDVLKAESSGSPGMTEDAKAAYMASFFEREGVRLEKALGKFCQRDDLTSTEIVDSYEAWLQRLTTLDQGQVSFMMLEYKPRFGAAGERAFKYANVPIGVFTTSHARLRLYEALEGLGTRVIYADTDSVVYRCSPGEYEPPGGSSLGQWTDEGTCWLPHGTVHHGRPQAL
uniref:DNA-directed DNA polymerase n=1 Tax=Macrostomum lignano TaxID=282301 RepID=A0A1I8J691_9PLAT